MELGAYWALPPIDLSAKEIRVLDFSETYFPLFDGNSNVRCTFSTISLLERPPEYTIISHVPSPGGELARGLVIDGRPLRIPANFIEALKPLVKEGGFLGMRCPVRLWLEDVCVNRSSAEEMEYMRALIPEVYAKSAYNVCYLGSGDVSISTFFGVSRLLFRHVDPSELDTQGLSSWEATLGSLYRYSEPGFRTPETLAEYCRLATHFFEHLYWSRLRSLREYLSVETVGFIHGDAIIRDHMLVKAGMPVLQQEEALLPRNTLPESSVPAGPDRDAISAGMRSWRTLVQWELAREFIKLKPHRGTFVWQYLAQLAPRISIGDNPRVESMYLHLLVDILDAGHSWSTHQKPVHRSEDSDEYVPNYVLCLQSWFMRGYHLACSSSVPMSWPPTALGDLMLSSRENMSKGPMLFLTDAGIGLYGQYDGSRPSWVPDYDAVGRSPERVPSAFEIEMPWSQRRYGFQFRGGRLEVLGSMAGKLDIVKQVPKPGDAAELFGSLRELPEYGVCAPQNSVEAIHRVKSVLDALFLDKHDPSASAAFHRCVGTLLLTPQEDSNTILRLLGTLPSDEVMNKAERVREVLFPDVGREAADTYAHDWAAGAARQLATERFEAVGRHYALGRYYEHKHHGVRNANSVGRWGWGLVPRVSEVGDAVWRVMGYGVAVVLRGVGTRRCLVGACGIDVEWLRHCRYYIEVRIS